MDRKYNQTLNESEDQKATRSLATLSPFPECGGRGGGEGEPSVRNQTIKMSKAWGKKGTQILTMFSVILDNVFFSLIGYKMAATAPASHQLPSMKTGAGKQRDFTWELSFIPLLYKLKVHESPCLNYF